MSSSTLRLLLVGFALVCVAGLAAVAMRSAAPVDTASPPAASSTVPTPVPAPAPAPSAGTSPADAPGSGVLRPQFAESAAVLASYPLVRGSRVRMAVELRIQDGYHVNANPPTEDWLIPTEVAIEDAADLRIVEVFYPEAEEQEFGFWSGPLRVYEGAIAIGVVVEVDGSAALGDRDLGVAVTYQACNDEACFAPTQARTRIPVEVADAGTATRPLASPLLDRARFSGDD